MENIKTKKEPVDRLDYTKGIDRRVKAIEKFFLKYPKYKGEVTLNEAIQVNPYHPSEVTDALKKHSRPPGRNRRSNLTR